MKAHPIAEIFPMMDQKSLSSLSDDIKKHGLLEPIIVYEGMILDGRNRAVACEMAGVSPRMVDFDDTSVNPVEFVWSKNSERHHMGKSQLAAIRNESLKKSKKWIDAKIKALAGADKKQSGAEKKRPHNDEYENMSPVFYLPEPLPYSSSRFPRGLEVRRLAAAAGVGASIAQEIISAEKERPDLYEKIKQGMMTAKEASRIRYKDKKLDRMFRQINASKEHTPVSVKELRKAEEITSGIEVQREGQASVRDEVRDPYIGKIYVIRITPGSIAKLNVDTKDFQEEEMWALTREERRMLMKKLRAMD